MKREKVRVYVRGRGFFDIAKNVLDKIVGNTAAKTFALSALNTGAKVGGEKLGEAVAAKLVEKVLPSKELRNTLDDLEMKVKRDIEKYQQTGKGYKIIK